MTDADFTLAGATLVGSTTSPFVRKVRIVLYELGLQDAVTFLDAPATPLDPPGARAAAPLGKIPFLTLADGALVADSRVVVEAALLAADVERSAALLPASPRARLDTLTRQATADGLCDVAVAAAYERRLRPEALQWPEWRALQLGKVAAALDWFEAAPPPAGRFDVGDCALYSSLVYLDFRYNDLGWRDARPALAAFAERAADRASVRAAA